MQVVTQKKGVFVQKNPRFHPDNHSKNHILFERVATLAKKHGCTPGQLALAWVQHQGADVIPIPGTHLVMMSAWGKGMRAVSPFSAEIFKYVSVNMSECQNVRMAEWQNVRMSNWQNVRMEDLELI